MHGPGDNRDVLHDSQRAGAPYLAQHADSRANDAAFQATRTGKILGYCLWRARSMTRKHLVQMIVVTIGMIIYERQGGVCRVAAADLRTAKAWKAGSETQAACASVRITTLSVFDLSLPLHTRPVQDTQTCGAAPIVGKVDLWGSKGFVLQTRRLSRILTLTTLNCLSNVGC